MAGIKGYKQVYKSIVLMLVVLLALSPCPVRETILSAAGLEYNRPMNQAKATVSPVPGCGQVAEAHKVSVSKPDAAAAGFAESPARIPYYRPRSEKPAGSCTPAVAGNSPPRYILFKRLKFHLV